MLFSNTTTPITTGLIYFVASCTFTYPRKIDAGEGLNRVKFDKLYKPTYVLSFSELRFKISFSFFCKTTPQVEVVRYFLCQMSTTLPRIVYVHPNIKITYMKYQQWGNHYFSQRENPFSIETNCTKCYLSLWVASWHQKIDKKKHRFVFITLKIILILQVIVVWKN